VLLAREPGSFGKIGIEAERTGILFGSPVKFCSEHTSKDSPVSMEINDFKADKHDGLWVFLVVFQTPA